MHKIGIFIPCYNVQNSIRAVLEGFSLQTMASIDAIVAIDNCSQDNTLTILKDIQSSSVIGKRLVILSNSKNYGLGGSQKIAYRFFMEQGFTHFMIVHGDNQGDGEEIAKGFLKILNKRPDIDIVIASRFSKDSHNAQYDPMRIVGNLLFNFLTFVCTGHQMSDSGAAILLIRTEVLRRVPFMELTNSFQFNPQLNILFYNLRDLKIMEVPMTWRDSKDKSNITAFNYCSTLLKILLRYRWNKTVLRKSGWEMFHQDSRKFEPAFATLRPSPQLSPNSP